MAERCRISQEQRKMMLEFVKKHPIIAYGRVDSSESSKHRSQLLIEMAELLNNETGPKKSVEKWLRSWQDWKSDTKKKLTRTELEQDLMDFLGTLPITEIPNYVADAQEETSADPRAHSPSSDEYESDTADPIHIKIEKDAQMYEPKSKRKRKNSESIEERMVTAMEQQASSTLEVARQLGRLADVVAMYLKTKTQQGGDEF